MTRVTRSLGSVLLVVLASALAQSCGRDDDPPSAPDESLSRGPLYDRSRDNVDGRIQFPYLNVSGACDITAAVDLFRLALGSLNPNQAGEFPSGRREINWDGVPATLTNNNAFPSNFFNTNSPRGVVFFTPGSRFRVSDNNFSDVVPPDGEAFRSFSPIKTFSPIGSNRTLVRFFVAGSSTPAATTGFGVVFSDVDRTGSAELAFFDRRGELIGVYAAPACPGARTLSFVGVTFFHAIVAAVEIRSGRGALGDLDGHSVDGDNIDGDNVDGARTLKRRDLVIMDDFIYGEPHAIR